MRRTVFPLSTIAVLFIILFSGLSLAAGTLPTPKQPVTIVQKGAFVHVLCNRTDVNFNDVEEAGESPGAWLIFDAETKSLVRTLTFPWAEVKAHRVAVTDNHLYIGIDDNVSRYTVGDQKFVDVVYDGAVSAVSEYEKRDVIAVSVRPSYSDPGYVQFLNLKNLSGNVIEVSAGVNVQQVLQFDGSKHSYRCIVSEGSFGGKDGTVQVYQTDMSTMAVMDSMVVTGGVANFAALNEDSTKVYAVMNGTHEVVEIGLSPLKELRRISMGTTGYDGPRECVIHDGRLFVSTFSGDVRIFDLYTGDKVGSIALSAKPEGLALVNNELWVTRSFELGGYSAMPDIDIYALNTATSVEKGTYSPTRTGVLTTSSTMRVPEFSGSGFVHAVSVNGTKTRLAVASDNTILLNNLSNGVYIIQNGKRSMTLNYQPLR